MKKTTDSIKIVVTIGLMLTLLQACQNTKKVVANSWLLNPDYSSLSIITTKNDSVSEVSEFQNIKGSINASLYMSIEIDLNSLETHIPIRNERIKKHLFNTAVFPTADIHTQLKAEDLTAGVHSLTFDVDLNGVSGIMQGEFMVFDSDGTKVVTLHKPLIIQAKDFALEAGITALRKIAKLQSIDFTVPVHLVLTFEKH